MKLRIAQTLILILYDEKIMKTVEGEVSLCLACFGDMLLENVVEVDDDFSVFIMNDLPEDLSYCKPIYEEVIHKKGKKLKDIIAPFVISLNKKKRKKIIDGISAFISISQQERMRIKSTLGKKASRDRAVKERKQYIEQLIAEAPKVQQETAMLFQLILKNKKARNLFSDDDIQQMRKVLQECESKQGNEISGSYKEIIDEVMAEISALAAAVSASSIILG